MSSPTLVRRPALAAAAQTRSIPTLMALRDGVLVFAQPGALPTAGLEEPIRAVCDLDMDEVRTKAAGRVATLVPPGVSSIAGGGT